MLHTLNLNASQFSEAVKDAVIYTGKDRYDDMMNSVILSITSKGKKLSVVACDGNGYYERRLNLLRSKGDPKPTLPGKESRICIASQDAAMLSKFITPRTMGGVMLELDDAKASDGRYRVRLSLADGASTTFLSRADVNIPDYSPIVASAEKGRKTMPKLGEMYIPVSEMARASKVFPSKYGKTARISTAKGNQQTGCLALLEYQEEDSDVDIRVIFMLSGAESAAA